MPASNRCFAPTATGVCCPRTASNGDSDGDRHRPHRGGQIAETWHNADMLGLFQQLGAVPQMAQSGA
jgi:hypothetical protein